MADESTRIDADAGIGLPGTSPGFKPYKSILKFSTSTRRKSQSSDVEDDSRKERRPPPWRRPVGSAFFNSGLGDPNDEQGTAYADMMERTFSGFSDTVIGADVPIVDFRDTEDDGTWTIDEDPTVPLIAGERAVLYHVADDIPAPTVTQNRNSRSCWNCGDSGHELFDCPCPRDQARIALARAAFNTQKESVPEYAMAHLWMYTFDVAERSRRLALIDRFRPGQISSSLADAIFATDEDTTPDDSERIANERRRRRYPWLGWMMKWGYPPGWIAGKDPIAFIRAQIEVMPLEELSLEDDEDALEVFGGHMDTSVIKSPSASSDMSLDSSDPSTPDLRPELPLADSIVARPPGSPPPPPPDESPPPPEPSSLDTPPTARLPMTRWAKYDTDLFDSDRLMAFTTARPLPLGC